MPVERMPISPEVLTWARERLGYSQEALAAKRKDFRKVAEWERGKSRPTYRQLEKLAKDLWLPVAVFFLPEPPDWPPIEETFRTLGSEQFDEVPPSIRKLLYKARAFQVGLSELNDGRNPPRAQIIRDIKLDIDEELSIAAKRARNYIGISLERQLNWNSAEEALKHWRSALFKVGVTVFKDAFKTDDYSGFSLYDDEFPIIYVNNSNAKTRQIFTLFHELAHLLFHTSGVDSDSAFRNPLPEEYSRIEMRCNAFAGVFLVPDEAFDRILIRDEDPVTEAARLSAMFCVSREVILRKILDRQFISSPEYRKTVATWRSETRPASTGGGNYFRTQIAYLGEEYIELAFRRLEENVIDEEELADYLAVAPKNLDRLEDLVFGTRS
ncbi:MAG: ImmA/IrrE family metallo-endopeptidase [Chloroflexi bacterium]|nr:ImmA/IrrE family metallo-endopeptidase [Chloroflexota bacterium]MDE2650982.1 ImmA/IrrE family metallo-endopeptidase [Chloroflexota bacterium]MXX51250.1 ImmA/IrrE family metallo-endopeptidase [Chloroflexota bacterium]MXX84193.1 ImmA/IrrE family metallo-endopeptidase [Chloroflexota bacterium]MYA92863.1 ImmA/IrrE family metallo-endopeptidase [Chloroflexota bacterium]